MVLTICLRHTCGLSSLVGHELQHRQVRTVTIVKRTLSGSRGVVAVRSEQVLIVLPPYKRRRLRKRSRLRSHRYTSPLTTKAGLSSGRGTLGTPTTRCASALVLIPRRPIA